MKNKKIKILSLISVILVIIIGVVAIIYFNLPKSSKFTPYEIQNRSDKINQTKIGQSSAIGWIRVQGTNIDYPIIFETKSAFQSGDHYTWVADFAAEDENRQAIYGHNIQNVSPTPMINNPQHVRFEQLMAFTYADFAEENLYVQYSRDGVDSLYKIYAVSFMDQTEVGALTRSREETEEYIKQAKDSSLYKYDIEVNGDDELISVITCTRYFGINGKTQFRVDARKVRSNEKTEKYSVQKTKNYDIIK